MKPLLTLKIVAPDGKKAELECESVNLVARDNASGRGGGSVGIRPGHLPAVIALGKGEVCAFTQGEKVYSAAVFGGFALGKNNTVTVMTEGNQ